LTLNTQLKNPVFIIKRRKVKSLEEMEQAQKARDREQAGAWDEVKPTVAEVRAVDLPQVRVGPAFAQAVEQRPLTR
jgi:hypothetical protein